MRETFFDLSRKTPDRIFAGCGKIMLARCCEQKALRQRFLAQPDGQPAKTVCCAAAQSFSSHSRLFAFTRG
jgi:hypothetical protein